MVQSSPLNECFEQTFETEYEVYKKYQTVIHKDTPEKCTKQQFRRFLVNSPLEVSIRKYSFTEIPRNNTNELLVFLAANFRNRKCPNKIFWFISPSILD